MAGASSTSPTRTRPASSSSSRRRSSSLPVRRHGSAERVCSHIAPRDEQHVAAAAVALALVAQEMPQEGPARLVRAGVPGHEGEDVAAGAAVLRLAAVAVVEQAEALALGVPLGAD